jgi:hypothetical protein
MWSYICTGYPGLAGSFELGVCIVVRVWSCGIKGARFDPSSAGRLQGYHCVLWDGNAASGPRCPHVVGTELLAVRAM